MTDLTVEARAKRLIAAIQPILGRVLSGPQTAMIQDSIRAAIADMLVIRAFSQEYSAVNKSA